MAFPSNPEIGDPHVIGLNTWYWDGNSWTLSPISTVDSDVEVLDDLLDVDTGGPPTSSQRAYSYYINEDPKNPNAWGRYSVDLVNRRVTFHRYDIDGNDLTELFNFSKSTEGRKEGTKHRVSAFDESFEVMATVTDKFTDNDTLFYEFTYDDREFCKTIDNNGESKLFTLFATDFGELTDGSILVYRQANEKWKPEPHVDGDGGGIGGPSGALVTISLNPPTNVTDGDLWIHELNYYLYVYQDGNWVALTGPEGGNSGGGNFANDKTITLNNMRGLYFDDNKQGMTFRLNQPFDSMFTISQKNIFSLGMSPHFDPVDGDMWIFEEDYTLYTYHSGQWIALTGSSQGESNSANRLEQPCVLNGGKPFSQFCEDGATSDINIVTTYISPDPPPSPKKGDLWFDSEHLELRVYYVTADSPPAWISSTHPGMRPTWAPPDNVIPIRIAGPSQAIQEVTTDSYVAILSQEVLDDPNRSNVTWGLGSAIIPATINVDEDSDHYINAQYKFHGFGVTQITANVLFTDSDGNYRDDTAFHRVSVTVLPPGAPITFHVTVIEDPDDADNLIYAIDGIPKPHLNLERNRRYIFDQTHPSNEGHPMAFYTALNRDPDQQLNDTINLTDLYGESGNEAGAVTRYGDIVDFVVPPDSPVRLAYGSDQDQYMGFWIYPFDPSGVVYDPNNPNQFPNPFSSIETSTSSTNVTNEQDDTNNSSNNYE